MNLRIAFLSLVLSFSAHASVSESIQTSEIQAAGAGCIGGKIETTLYEIGSDEALLVIDFPQYNIALETGSRIARLACNLTIPTTLNENERLSVESTSLFGFANAAAKVKGTLSSEVFIAGETGAKAETNYGETKRDSTYIAARSSEKVKSACGSSALLRVNTSNRMIASETTVEKSSSEVYTLLVRVKIEKCE